MKLTEDQELPDSSSLFTKSESPMIGDQVAAWSEGINRRGKERRMWMRRQRYFLSHLHHILKSKQNTHSLHTLNVHLSSCPWPSFQSLSLSLCQNLTVRLGGSQSFLCVRISHCVVFIHESPSQSRGTVMNDRWLKSPQIRTILLLLFHFCFPDSCRLSFLSLSLSLSLRESLSSRHSNFNHSLHTTSFNPATSGACLPLSHSCGSCGCHFLLWLPHSTHFLVQTHQSNFHSLRFLSRRKFWNKKPFLFITSKQVNDSTVASRRKNLNLQSNQWRWKTSLSLSLSFQFLTRCYWTETEKSLF